MKVLYLHRHNFEDAVGGVAEFFHYLPLFLRPYGVEVILYSEGKTQDITGPRSLKNQVPVYYGPFVKPKWFSFASRVKPVAELCEKLGIDVIHAHGTYRSGYLAQQIHKQTQLPFIVTSHSDMTFHSKRMQRGSIQRRCRDILKSATKVTHLAPHMADISHQMYDTRDKSVIIANGIDLHEWQPFSGLPEEDYMLSIGRLEPEKGFHILIDAYADFVKNGGKTALVIAGTGSTEEALKAQVQKHGLPLIFNNTHLHFPAQSVIFTGYVRGDMKRQLIAHSKIILFAPQPSIWEEAFGIVQLEAMAAGRTLIVSDTASSRHLQSLGMQALLVPADSAAAWSQSMRQLVQNDAQRALWNKINLENSKAFDWKVIANEYFELYQSCIR